MNGERAVREKEKSLSAGGFFADKDGRGGLDEGPGFGGKAAEGERGGSWALVN